MGKGFTTRGFMRQFKPFALAGEDHGMVADDIATAQRMHSDLLSRSLARDSGPAMAKHLLKLLLARFGKDLSQRRRRAAGSVLFHAVMHLDHFDVKAGPKDFRSLA